ncbi:MAG: alpha-1,6-mannosyltransferase [Rhodothermales bacterium]|jgi:alpha-1,6-mannosyltransferase
MTGKRSSRLLACGAAILLAFAGILLLSFRFVYGEGHTERPIVLFQLVYSLAWIGFGIAAWRLWKGDVLTLPLILLLAAGMRIVLLPSAVIQEDDFYRYIWDGQMLLHGNSPYVAAPEHISARELEGDSVRLEQAEFIHSRINHPRVKTIYPPVAQAAFATNGLLWGWRSHGFRYTWLLVDALVIGLLLLALRSAHLDPRFILLYAWNPLVLKEYINGMHLDIVALLFLAIFAVGVLLQRHWLGMFGLVCATLVKLVPVALIPLHLAYVWQRGDRKLAISLGIGAALAGAASLGLMFIGASAPLEGLQAFAGEWQANGSLFPLMQTIAESAMNGDVAGQVTRGASALLFAAWVLWAMRRLPDTHSLFTACLYTMLLAFLLGPVGNPWYLGWALPFFVLTRNPLALLTMAMTSLYYLNFYLIYHDAPERDFTLLKMTEYFPVLIMWVLLRDNRVQDVPADIG